MNIIRKQWIGFIFAAFLSLTACGHGGTDTPNPAISGDPIPTSDPDAYPVEDIPAITAIEDLIGFVCDKMNECHPEISVTTCEADMLDVTNIDTEIGLEIGQYGSLLDVRSAERNDKLVPVTSAAINCLDTISNLSCTNIPNDFNQSYRMIPASCRGIY